MSTTGGTRAKPLNKNTRESLGIALEVLHDEYQYLEEALRGPPPLSPVLRERFLAKKEHLQRAGTWIESKLASKED